MSNQNYGDRLADYVDVAERIRMFRAQYPEGSLQPANPREPYKVEIVDGATFIVYVAAAYRTPDDTRPGIGMAWEPFPGRTPYTKDSEIMVAETSAWGRAIKACLLDDRSKVASLDEVRARRSPSDAPERPQTPRTGSNGTEGRRMASDGQKRFLRTLANERGYDLPDLDKLTAKDAYDLTETLKAMPRTDDTPEEPF